VGLTLIASLALTATVIGGVLGASTQFAAGPTESGEGAYVAQTGLAYWSWEQTHVGAIPNPIPARVSVAEAAPTVLPRATAGYTINPAVVGQASVEWSFQESTATPARTELEIRFVDGISQPASSVTIYVESQNAIPAGAVVYEFYWASPAYPPAFLLIESMQASVFVCSAIGACP
ncbi:MAG: hypothetical protein WAN87_08785, partial [Thermoplasmata archaeon]